MRFSDSLSFRERKRASILRERNERALEERERERGILIKRVVLLYA